MNTKKVCITLLFITASQLSYGQSDGWLKKKWSNMIARYNIYFNANEKFNSEVESLADKHVDDFTEIIDVLPYGTDADANAMKAGMEEVMKKASKIIQNRPKSKWVDDAYLLIGKTHFFKNDQYSAVEAFQFVYTQYGESEIKNDANLWVLKSYLRSGRLNEAEGIITGFKEDEIRKDLKSDFHQTAAQVYIEQENYAKAIIELEEAIKFTKKKDRRYRLHFILGQLYLAEEQYELAGDHFLKVVKMNSPYEFDFQANMGLTQVAAKSGKNTAATSKYLKRMLKDDKNISYFDQIYYELAQLEFANGNEAAAVEYLQKSSANNSNNTTQATQTYLALADYYFDSRSYSNSQSYYDSAVNVITEEHPEYEKIKAKYSVLSDLIEHLETISLQDSLLDLSNLSREVLDKRIDQLVEDKLEQDRIAKDDEERQRQLDAMENQNNNNNNAGPIGGSGQWYFYNQNAKSRGFNEFKRKWGSRPYRDNWRLNALASQLVDAGPDDQEDTPDVDTYNADDDKEQQEALKDVSADKKKYYKDIPFSSIAKTVANSKIEDAYMGAASIYQNNLKEYEQAIDFYNKLLNRYSSTSYKAEAYFNLSKCYSSLGNESKAQTYNQKIASEFKNSVYNDVLNNKEVVEGLAEDDGILNAYKGVYEAYKAGNYQKVKDLKIEADKQYAGNSIQAKFDYIYALAVAKTESRENFISRLEAIVESYSGTEIATQAQSTLDLLKKDPAKAEKESELYIFKPNQGHVVVIVTSIADSKKAEVALTKYNKANYSKKTFEVKSIILGKESITYIKPFRNHIDALKYYKDNKDNKVLLSDLSINNPTFFVISEENLRALITSRDKSAYLAFFEENYL